MYKDLPAYDRLHSKQKSIGQHYREYQSRHEHRLHAQLEPYLYVKRLFTVGDTRKGFDSEGYLLLTGTIERMSSSFDCISQAINSTFDFEDFSKVALTKNTQLDKILLESKKTGWVWIINIEPTLYFGHHILS